VVSGDSLFRIAINQDVSLAALREANPQLSGDFIDVGDVLSLPGCIATNGTIIRPTSTPAPSATLTPIGGSSQTIHTVASGDTLFSIALNYGVTVAEIVEANNLDNPNSLSIGQELIIPELTIR
jgi:LysM repeat protein